MPISVIRPQASSKEPTIRSAAFVSNCIHLGNLIFVRFQHSDVPIFDTTVGGSGRNDNCLAGWKKFHGRYAVRLKHITFVRLKNKTHDRSQRYSSPLLCGVIQSMCLFLLDNGLERFIYCAMLKTMKSRNEPEDPTRVSKTAKDPSLDAVTSTSICSLSLFLS